ncbi:restriction endonuclease subunit S [Enterobacter hormaechei subsp. steigerwaltii]|nr:restriction endonuclease subunit S [Enterobacter hormaechei subsp. steigerwaltii]
MAKYKAYPEYKDSGVEWLGEIPIHWKMLRHKYVAFFTKGKNPTNLLEQPLKNTLPYLSMECLRNNTADKYALISNDVRVVLEGQPLIIWDGSNAGEFVKGKSGILSSTMAAATLTYPLYSQYYWYLCISIEPEIRKNAVGMGIPHVNGDELKSISFGIPSIYEQKQVAEFLDHETAKIDNLIEKQQQLIELLKEKRQAVISHAVTKGLNPDVPMKDSGVDWLGEVPEHWTIAQLKFNTLEMQTGPFGSQLHAEDYVIDGIPLINPAHMNAGMIIPDPKVTVDEATQERLGRHKLSEGEIIFSRRGELGRCAVVKKNNEGWLCGTGSLKAKLTKKIIPDYAYTLISSEGVVSELTLESKGSTMPNLNTETLGRIRLPIPPISEQEAILDYIKIISDKYDYLIRSADTAIRLMQERRTALISAAVTGKINVRDWVAPDTQDVEEPQEATA